MMNEIGSSGMTHWFRVFPNKAASQAHGRAPTNPYTTTVFRLANFNGVACSGYSLTAKWLAEKRKASCLTLTAPGYEESIFADVTRTYADCA